MDVVGAVRPVRSTTLLHCCVENLVLVCFASPLAALCSVMSKINDSSSDDARGGGGEIPAASPGTPLGEVQQGSMPKTLL